MKIKAMIEDIIATDKRDDDQKKAKQDAVVLSEFSENIYKFLTEYTTDEDKRFKLAQAVLANEVSSYTRVDGCSVHIKEKIEDCFAFKALSNFCSKEGLILQTDSRSNGCYPCFYFKITVLALGGDMPF